MTAGELPATPWPADGIEVVGACPVCGSGERDLLFSGLRDRIFHCAPGEWDMQRCRDCGSGYLDPRPTPDTIHLAYANYYTHRSEAHRPTAEMHGLRRIQRLLANGYKNWRFGTDLQPSSRWGMVVAHLMPARRAIVDRQYRNLPRRAGGGRLLDIGFGNGDFLDHAREMGWRVVGTDMDPKVVDNARRRGLDARPGTVEGVEGPFDVITMNHVIEHLHDPVAILRACHHLLAPGGMLWLETPNVDAVGLRWFGADWRGLEPPRHLILFNRRSLMRALRGAGFGDVRDIRQASVAKGMYAQSKAIAERRDPNGADRNSLRTRAAVFKLKLLEWLRPSRREFLAMTARKAGGEA